MPYFRSFSFLLQLYKLEGTSSILLIFYLFTRCAESQKTRRHHPGDPRIIFPANARSLAKWEDQSYRDPAVVGSQFQVGASDGTLSDKKRKLFAPTTLTACTNCRKVRGTVRRAAQMMLFTSVVKVEG